MEAGARATPEASAATPPTFELVEFAWAAPDRLRVSGRFAGVGELPARPPVLIVHGERTHHLPAVPVSVDGVPQDGARWRAVFAWPVPPIAFDAAELDLGDGVRVDLPPVGEDAPRPRILEVRRRSGHAGGAADLLRAQADLIAAQEEVVRLRAALEDAELGLSRAREDLLGERERRAGDARRFQEGLARVRESADEAVSRSQRRAADLESALAAVRADLEAARARESGIAAAARTEADGLRERIAALERVQDEAGSVRAQLDGAAREAERARHRLEAIRRALDEER